jgi:hypothetical protein
VVVVSTVLALATKTTQNAVMLLRDGAFAALHTSPATRLATTAATTVPTAVPTPTTAAAAAS